MSKCSTWTARWQDGLKGLPVEIQTDGDKEGLVDGERDWQLKWQSARRRRYWWGGWLWSQWWSGEMRWPLLISVDVWSAAGRRYLWGEEESYWATCHTVNIGVYTPTTFIERQIYRDTWHCRGFKMASFVTRTWRNRHELDHDDVLHWRSALNPQSKV